jgi:hypothetical protein
MTAATPNNQQMSTAGTVSDWRVTANVLITSLLLSLSGMPSNGHTQTRMTGDASPKRKKKTARNLIRFNFRVCPDFEFKWPHLGQLIASRDIILLQAGHSNNSVSGMGDHSGLVFDSIGHLFFAKREIPTRHGLTL